MRGRIRIAAVGLLALTAVGAVSSAAGAQANPWSVQSHGGFVSAEASGTGACRRPRRRPTPCPTSATSSLSGLASTSTQDAVAQGAGVTATPTGSSSCVVPLDTGLINVNVSCGMASASEDGNGNPTASGTGSLANVSISLSLVDVLESLLGGSLPSASSVCNDVPAASGAAGSNTNPLAPGSHGASCQVSGVEPGQLSGILAISALDLDAPVEEGTDDQELNVAVGHDPQSVWPGADGAAVFLAHDVSYFVHLNELEPGDVITYQTACNTVKFQVSEHQVVLAGSAVSNTTDPSLVLDTCWPPNALFFTPDRLLIRATEVGAATKGRNLDAAPRRSRSAASRSA